MEQMVCKPAGEEKNSGRGTADKGSSGLEGDGKEGRCAEEKRKGERFQKGRGNNSEAKKLDYTASARGCSGHLKHLGSQYNSRKEGSGGKDCQRKERLPRLDAQPQVRERYHKQQATTKKKHEELLFNLDLIELAATKAQEKEGRNKQNQEEKEREEAQKGHLQEQRSSPAQRSQAAAARKEQGCHETRIKKRPRAAIADVSSTSTSSSSSSTSDSDSSSSTAYASSAKPSVAIATTGHFKRSRALSSSWSSETLEFWWKHWLNSSLFVY